MLGSPQTKYQLVIGKVQALLQDHTTETVRVSIGKDMEWGPTLMPSRLKKG